MSRIPRAPEDIGPGPVLLRLPSKDGFRVSDHQVNSQIVRANMGSGLSLSKPNDRIRRHITLKGNALRLRSPNRTRIYGVAQDRSKIEYESLNTLIAARKPVLIDQILLDTHRVAAPRQLQLDHLPIRFTGSGRALTTLLLQRQFRQKAGNHFVGRF
jgi:hypothetical protein